MAKTTDAVLADLQSIGAVGRSQKTPVIPDATVTEVEIEQGPPSVWLRDRRRGRTVEAVDDALRYLDDAMHGLEGVREAFVALRRVWESEDEADESTEWPIEASEPPLEAPEAPEPPPVPSDPERVVQDAQPPVVMDEAELDRAREAARQKILGLDIPPEQRAAADEAADVPYVGQVRALLSGQEPEEITIGTVGTTKLSFPVED